MLPPVLPPLPPLFSVLLALQQSNSKLPLNTKQIFLTPDTYFIEAEKSFHSPFVFEMLIVPSNVPDGFPSLTSIEPFPLLLTPAVIVFKPLLKLTPFTFVKSPL